MDFFNGLILSLATKYPPALAGLSALGSLVVLASAYIKLTPTQDDDKWLIKVENHPIYGLILRQFTRFSIFERKEKPNG
jgi:hypothetical protein